MKRLASVIFTLLVLLSLLGCNHNSENIEDPANFYFGGSVTTDKFKKIDLMGDEVVTTLKSNGLPVIFEEKKSKSSGMKYHDMVIKA